MQIRARFEFLSLNKPVIKDKLNVCHADVFTYLTFDKEFFELALIWTEEFIKSF